MRCCAAGARIHPCRRVQSLRAAAGFDFAFKREYLDFQFAPGPHGFISFLCGGFDDILAFRRIDRFHIRPCLRPPRSQWQSGGHATCRFGNSRAGRIGKTAALAITLDRSSAFCSCFSMSPSPFRRAFDAVQPLEHRPKWRPRTTALSSAS